MTPKLKLCAGRCGKELPEHNFGRHTRTGRLRPRCLACEAEERREQREEHKTFNGRERDYAWLYRPVLKKHAPESKLTNMDLRAIMELQQRRDPFTGRSYILPKNAQLYTGWGAWLMTVPADVRETATPLLVRVSSEKPWEVGNVVFLPRAIAQLAMHYGSLGELRQLLRSPHIPITVPMDTEVLRWSDEWRATQRDEAIADAKAGGLPGGKRKSRRKRSRKPRKRKRRDG